MTSVIVIENVSRNPLSRDAIVLARRHGYGTREISRTIIEGLNTVYSDLAIPLSMAGDDVVYMSQADLDETTRRIDRLFYLAEVLHQRGLTGYLHEISSPEPSTEPAVP